LQVLANGYAPLPNIDKRCILKGWPTLIVDEAEVRRWSRMGAYEATGVRLEGGLAVIDLDVDVENFEDLVSHLIGTFPELERALFRTGAGHKEAWYVRTDEPFSRIASPLFMGNDHENGLRVEIFGGGVPRQFGSFGWHTKGELEYTWINDQSPATVPLADLPLLTKNDMFGIVDAVTDWLRAQDYEHLTDEGSGETDPEIVFDLIPEMIFETMHDGQLGLAQLRDLGTGNCSASFISDAARNPRRCLIGTTDAGGLTVWDSMTGTTHMEASAAPVDTATLAQSVGSALAEAGVALPPPGPQVTDNSWRQTYSLTKDGAVRQHEDNLSIFLNDDEWEGVIRRSKFDHGTWIMRRMPGDEDEGEKYPRRMTDDDLSYMHQRALRDMFTGVGPQKVRSAVNMVARANAYHPVRDYLGGLEWDRSARLNDFAATYLGNSESSAYIRAVIRKWVISAVARVYRPGCQVDHMLVLQGPQGIGKSSALSILAGSGSWFGNDMPPVGLKDTKAWLNGKWIVEIAELSSISGRDVEHVKAFLTTRTDSFRKAYGYVVEDIPRQCVFAGSTNDEEYLLDTTGGRRFWPVRVSSVDARALRRDRDALWAEAVVAFRAGEAWHLDARTEADAEALRGALEAQEAVRTQYAEELPVREWLRHQEDDKILLSCDVSTGALHEALNDNTRHRVSRILGALGWVKTRRTKRGRTWKRGPNAEPYQARNISGKTMAEKAARKAAELGISVVEKPPE
jgi:predicted P-loop ATPase